jgi:hypothetical protein
MKLSAVRKFALSLPEVTEEPHFQFSSFRFRGKMLVTVPPEETHIHVFVPDQQREPALSMYPEFIEKLFWGGKVRGLRVALADARAEVVESLVLATWASRAPRSMVAAREARRQGKRK